MWQQWKQTWLALIASAAFAGCAGNEGSGQLQDGMRGEPDAATEDAGVDDAGSDPDAADELDPSDRLYDPERVLDVDLTIDEAAWADIRYEGRSLVDVFSGCYDADYAYSYVMASGLIDGEEMPEFAVRKKGFLGSLSSLRPSLRLDFNELMPEATFRGVSVLTLNNNRQDTSQARQCLAYAVFAAAGVPAPRCTFARVTVNGEDLGIYTNVEPVGKPLLARYFDDNEGNLYEGNAGSDFRPEGIDNFERKTNEDDLDRSDLEAVSDALELEPAEAIEELERLIDMDEFLRFWAIESLISHWDGYTGDLNNFFVYADPTSGKLAFVPWGTDGSFDKGHAFLPEVGRPMSAFAWARLPNKLYEWPETRERYRDTMRELLDTVWDEERWLGEIDRIAGLLGDAADPAELDALRELIRTRRAEIEAELDGEAPPWIFGERSEDACLDRSTDISGAFEVTWGDLEALAPGENAFVLTLDGEEQTYAQALGSAGVNSDGPSLAGPTVRLVVPHDDGSFTLVQVGIGPRELTEGVFPFHGLESAGVVVTGTSPDSQLRGFVGDGELVIESASTEPGGTVRGHFAGRVVPISL